ncbi:hypothetical protein FD754_003089 [Muntiacus muntjak]|uniref:Uncharacterized protein n=1 Tax=Muntiacus muntjak TaxID=9888 RepID=A0A5N3WBR1_MUNMU|nr:hypothetical protein FD754_003089 [Muntiacus muntjak]
MEFRKWNVLSFLNSPTDPCLSFGSTSLDIDSDLLFLCGLGLLLLFLWYLVGLPCLPTFCKIKGIQKHQGRTRRRRKGGTLAGKIPCWRFHQIETEEKTKLISIMKRSPFPYSGPGCIFVLPVSCSPQDRHDDTIRFRQLLCPDPFCEVCNNATAEVNWLLFPETLEDSASSMSPLASAAPVADSSLTLPPAFSAVSPGDLLPASLPESSPLPPSILPPSSMTPLADFFSPSPLGHTLALEPFASLDSEFPVDYSSPQPLAFSPLLPHGTQTADPVLPPEATLSLNTILSLDPTLSHDINRISDLSQAMNPTDSFAPPTLSVLPQPDCTLTVTQSKSIAILLTPVPENLPTESPGMLSTYVPKLTGIDHSRLSISDFSWWQAHAKDLIPSTLAQCDFNQEFLALHSSEASFGGDPAANLTEPGNFLSLSPDVLALLERQVQKKTDFLTWKEKEKRKDSFPEQLRPDYQVNSSGIMLESVADKPVHQQPPYPKTLEDQLQQKPTQLFWGLPSLHSESLPSAVPVSSDSSSNFIFNRNSNASTGQESPGLPHPRPLSLPEIQPEPLPQTLPQSQPLPLTQVQSQADPKSPLLVTPPGPLPQIRICGVYFHRPQNESESLSSSEIQQLEWNVLQKQQESLWGLPSVIQRSREDFCPLAPNTSHHRHPQAHVSVSVLPGEFALSNELRKKLEHHLRKRLIQHRWGLPRRIRESVSLMLPPTGFLEASKSESSDGISLISVFKGQSSKQVNVELSQPGSFQERSSEMLQLEEDVGKDQEHSQENYQKDHLLKDPNSSSDKDLGYGSEKNSQIVSFSEKNLRVSAESLQLENVLKVHLSKKFEEINEGRLPGTVHSSWHAIKQTLILSVKSHTEIKERSLPSPVGESYSLNTFQDLTFVDPSAQQMLEAHIKRFHMRMLWGLPSKVLESIHIFKLKDASSQSLSHASFPSSTNAISEADSKSGSSKSFRRSSKSFHGDEVGTTNSGPVLGHSLPATSPVEKGGKRVLRQTHSSKIKDPRQIRRPVSLCITGRGSHRQTQLADRYPQKPLAKQVGARYEPKYKSVSSSDKEKMQQGKKVEKEIFRAEELDTLQLKTNDMLTTNKSGSSQITNVNENKVETTVTTESPRPKLPVPQDPKRLSLKEQLFDELKFRLEKREHSQAQGQPTDMSLASDNLTYKASLTPALGVPGGDTGESQVLHVHVEDRGIRMEQQQEPWVPKHGLQRGQDKNFPPTVKTVSSPGCRAEELGGGDAGLGTSQLRRKSFPPQETVLEETLVSKSSQTLSKKGQPLPEGRIRKRMKHFLQWLYPGEKRKTQEDPQEKGSPIPSTQSRGLAKSRAAVTGSTEAQKIVTNIGKFLEEKLGYRHALDATSSQEDPPSPVHFEQSRQKAGVQVHTEPVRGHPFNSKAPSKVTNTKSCHQEAILAGQSYPLSTRQIRSKKRQPQKAVAFKDQQVCQKHPQSVPHREPVPHASPTHGYQAGQARPAAPATAEGTVFRDLSLLFRQKTLLQNFQGGKRPIQK